MRLRRDAIKIGAAETRPSLPVPVVSAIPDEAVGQCVGGRLLCWLHRLWIRLGGENLWTFREETE